MLGARVRPLVGHDKKVGRRSTEIRGGGEGNLREVEVPGWLWYIVIGCCSYNM